MAHTSGAAVRTGRTSKGNPRWPLSPPASLCGYCRCLLLAQLLFARLPGTVSIVRSKMQRHHPEMLLSFFSFSSCCHYSPLPRCSPRQSGRLSEIFRLASSHDVDASQVGWLSYRESRSTTADPLVPGLVRAYRTVVPFRA